MGNRYEFVPYKSFGEVAFGASRADARKQFGDFKEFKKSKFSKNTTDDFGAFHVFYDQNNCVEAVEVFDAEILINGAKLLSDSRASLKTIVAALGGEPVETSDSVNSPKLGISAYSPGNNEIESILLYKKGYFDGE